MATDRAVITELHKVARFLDRDNDHDSEVRESHFGIIMETLISRGRIDYKQFLSMMSLRCKMNKRYVRENYLDGLEAYNIISVTMSDGRTWIEYVGLPDENLDPRKEESPPKKSKKEIEKEEIAKADKELYSMYKVNCERDKEELLSYDEWLNKKYGDKK